MAKKKKRLTWKDVEEALKAGEVEGVPPGTDLAQFIWDHFPDSHEQLRKENPLRDFENKN
jgi:hypothetical protein